MSITLVGVFDNYTEAEKACKKLMDAGIDRQSMQLSGGQPTPGSAADRDDANDDEKSGTIGRFFSKLFGSEDSDEASHYSEAVRRGNAVLTVSASERRSEEISEILEDCGAIDVDERVDQWKADGYAPAPRSGTALGQGDESGAMRSSLPGYSGPERRYNRGVGFAGADRRAGL